MTMLMVDSEHDMEMAIAYTTELVDTLDGDKVISFSFPSRTLSKIFLNNLAETFHEKQMSPLSGLEINLFVPEGDGNV